MAAHHSFQDELAQQRAKAEQLRDSAERRAAHERMMDYRQGQAIATDIAGRVATFGRDSGQSAATLRKAAREQPDTLTGRVASGELGEAADRYVIEAERQRPQQEAGASLAILRARMAREHAERQGQIDRDWYRERER